MSTRSSASSESGWTSHRSPLQQQSGLSQARARRSPAARRPSRGSRRLARVCTRHRHQYRTQRPPCSNPDPSPNPHPQTHPTSGSQRSSTISTNCFFTRRRRGASRPRRSRGKRKPVLFRQRQRAAAEETAKAPIQGSGRICRCTIVRGQSWPAVCQEPRPHHMRTRRTSSCLVAGTKSGWMMTSRRQLRGS